MNHTIGLLAGAASLFAVVATAAAQSQPWDQRLVELDVNSGAVVNRDAERGVIFSETVNLGDVQWSRLMFEEVELGDVPVGATPTELHITSLQDGAVHILRERHVKQWNYASAYFNGGRLRVEIIADPEARPSHFKSTFGLVGPDQVDEGDRSICGSTDDRQLSNDARVARLVPVGCSAWLFNDANKCFLTAGHCTFAADVVQFNVPLSNGNGSINQPPPEDQYPVDPASMQSNGGQGVGNDYAYFGAFENSNTGLTPYEAQGDFFILADPPPSGNGSIRITGYGTTNPPVPNEWNQAQKTHTGGYAAFFGTTVQYTADTTGGNSGSPVIFDPTGEAIGIHTHGGCDQFGGQNSGTASLHPGLLEYLANPQGVCEPRQLDFSYPDGRPDLLSPSGASINVVIAPDQDQPAPGTAMLHYRVGFDFVTVPLVPTGPDTYRADFPTLPCGANVEYFLSAETTTGETITDPFTAPDSVFEGLAIDAFDNAFLDDFETDNGWTVVNNLADGGWTRGVPVGGGDRSDPPADADGSGACFLTDNTDDNSDVDDGFTVLTSPTLDATGGYNILSYHRWYHNTGGSEPAQDIFEVEISDDNGATWQTLEIVGPSGDEVSGGWFFKTFDLTLLPDFELTNTVRVRFIASDFDPQSLVEAGVDGVGLSQFVCETDCPADIANGDGNVNVDDLLALLAAWGPCDANCDADIDGNNAVDIDDLLTLLAAWGPCA